MSRAVLVDIPAARTWLPDLPASTIRVWVARGRLARRGTDRHGRGLYLLCDIEALASRSPAPAARWADLFGIDPNFTGSASTEEYLEANRGEA